MQKGSSNLWAWHERAVIIDVRAMPTATAAVPWHKAHPACCGPHKHIPVRPRQELYQDARVASAPRRIVKLVLLIF